MYEYWAIKHNYFTNVERLDNDLIKIKCFPKAIQLLKIPESVMDGHILLLLEDRRVLLINKTHPRGVELKLPAIARIYEHRDRTFLLDQTGRLAQLQYDRNEQDMQSLIDLMNTSFNNPIIDNVMMISFNNWLNSAIYTLNHENALTVIHHEHSTNTNRIVSIKTLDKEVKTMSGDAILYTDGTVESIESRIISESKAPVKEYNYFTQALTTINTNISHLAKQVYHVFVIDNNGDLISYRRKGRVVDEKLEFYVEERTLAHNALKFREYLSKDCVEFADGRVMTLHRLEDENLAEYTFPCKLFDIDEFNKLEKRNLIVKRASR